MKYTTLEKISHYQKLIKIQCKRASETHNVHELHYLCTGLLRMSKRLVYLVELNEQEERRKEEA